ncbi:MAG: cytidylate kinase-like family protein [Clostridia bacterium]|nr:cytidylate kinase-like family protein [Clostridia bacterium]
MKKVQTQETIKKVKEKPLSNFCITISREFGSGGKYIAEQLAKRFKIKCYDNEILKKLSKETKIDVKALENLEDDSFLYDYAKNTVFAGKDKATANEQLFMAQAKIIEDLYKKGSCVFVGRCAESILSSFPNVFSIFIYASNKDYKIKRKMKYENLSKEEAEQKIGKIDKQRAAYYNKHTGKTWGEKSNYFLTFDTSKYGIKETIDTIEQYIRLRLNQ